MPENAITRFPNLPSLPQPRPRVSDQELFELIDSDHSGTISRDEWSRTSRGQDLFEAYNRSGSGEIDKAEFSAGQGLLREFRALDQDRSGGLDRGEFEGLRRIYALGQQAVQGLRDFVDRFTSFDTNQDDVISPAEYVKGRQAEATGGFPRPRPTPDPFPRPDWGVPPTAREGAHS